MENEKREKTVGCMLRKCSKALKLNPTPTFLLYYRFT